MFYPKCYDNTIQYIIGQFLLLRANEKPLLVSDIFYNDFYDLHRRVSIKHHVNKLYRFNS